METESLAGAFSYFDEAESVLSLQYSNNDKLENQEYGRCKNNDISAESKDKSETSIYDSDFESEVYLLP